MITPLFHIPRPYFYFFSYTPSLFLFSQKSPLPNKIGVDIGNTPVVLEENTIAHNTEKGVNATGAGVVLLTQNRIYENGDDTGVAGITFSTAPIDAPMTVAALRSEPDEDGNVTIHLAISPAGSEDPVTYEVFSDLERDHPQGRLYILSRSASGNDSFYEEIIVPVDHPLATAKSVTVTKTLDGKTSEFSTRSIVEPYEIPELKILPTGPEHIKLAWVKTDAVKLQEAFTLKGPWFDSEAKPVVDDGLHVATIQVVEGTQFFRLVLDPRIIVVP